MTAFAIDSSCVIAAVCSWHESHERVFTALNARIGRGGLVVPSHALLESYAVLTRLPPPHRLAPADAEAVLRGFLEEATLAALGASDQWPLLRALSAERIAGGASYDALILAIARKAKCRELWTLNTAHFLRFESDIEIIDPAHA